MQTAIPLLQNVRVASPCDASWEGMEAIEGERVKFCLHCAKNVYNLSEMTQGEAEGLLRKHEGKLCVRYYQRRDGTVLTRDCPIGAQAVRMALIRRSTVAASLFAMLFGVMAAVSLSGSHLQGDVAEAPVPIAGGITPQPQILIPPVAPEPPVPLMGAVAPPVTMGKPMVPPPPVHVTVGRIARPKWMTGEMAVIPDKPHDYDNEAAQDSTDEAILKPQK